MKQNRLACEHLLARGILQVSFPKLAVDILRNWFCPTAFSFAGPVGRIDEGRHAGKVDVDLRLQRTCVLICYVFSCH